MDETRGDDRNERGPVGGLVEDVLQGGDAGRDRDRNDLAPTVRDEARGPQQGSGNSDLGEEDVDQSAGGA